MPKRLALRALYHGLHGLGRIAHHDGDVTIGLVRFILLLGSGSAQHGKTLRQTLTHSEIVSYKDPIVNKYGLHTKIHRFSEQNLFLSIAMKTYEALVGYLGKVLGRPPEMKLLSGQQRAVLPLYLRSYYPPVSGVQATSASKVHSIRRWKA